MLKLVGIATLALSALLVPAGGAHATVLGPHAAQCAPGAEGLAMLVRITGLKSREGTIRVQSYGGAPSQYFEKGTWLKRIELALPPRGPVEVCMPVPAAGTYAIAVRHDANGNGKADKADGGGMSGNPSVSLLDVVFKRKPDPGDVAVRVGGGVLPVKVVMSYVQGTSFRPLATAAR